MLQCECYCDADTRLTFSIHQGLFISVPNCQSTIQLIFRKNESGAFSESLRPPSIHCRIYHDLSRPLKAFN